MRRTHKNIEEIERMFLPDRKLEAGLRGYTSMLVLAFVTKLLGLGSPRLWWAIVGLVLWGLEFLTPADLILFLLGACALAVAVLTPILPSFGLQLVVWLALSGIALVGLRALGKRLYSGSHEIEPDTEGETLTAIPPGEPGRVLYEGTPGGLSQPTKSAASRQAAKSRLPGARAIPC